MNYIQLDNVKFTYNYNTDDSITAVNLSLNINKGEFVALVGHNGSGKSTVAKLLNGLLVPQDGDVIINGLNTKDRNALFDIRKTVGVVFQNPDNQMVATIIEDDIAFGPENIGLPPAEISARVEWALSAVNMSEHRHGTPFRLSGGQKQRIAIAGILAIKPDVLVLDESTSMLDPEGRQEVLKVLIDLNKNNGITVIMITHFMEEAVLADRIIVMHEGAIALDGNRDIFLQSEKIISLGLELPLATDIANKLADKGFNIPRNIIFKDELVQAIKDNNLVLDVPQKQDGVVENNEKIITAKNLSYTYSPKTPFEKQAIYDINLDVFKGDFLGVIGHTGSGKSTLVSHFNALIKLTSGQLIVDDIDLSTKQSLKKQKRKDIKKATAKQFMKLRSTVGMVFQYPEYQLFDETVALDVAFGPKNLGLDKLEIDARVREAIDMVGLDYNAIAHRSPFEISGGQKRRVAIAGVIAMRPKILVLDEPTAGLDPRGRKEIMALIHHIRTVCNTTIMVSHDMDEIARNCNKVLVLNKGRLAAIGTPSEIYGNDALLDSCSLKPPKITEIVSEFGRKDIFSVEELIKTFL